MAQLYRFLGRERVDHIESQKGIGKPKKRKRKSGSHRKSERNRKTKKGAHSRTSSLESVSASLRLISLAIEKKTSSTFIFVFALCRTYSFVYEQNRTSGT